MSFVSGALEELKEKIKRAGQNIVSDGIKQYFEENSPPQPLSHHEYNENSTPYLFEFDDVSLMPLFTNKYMPVVNASDKRNYYMSRYGLQEHHINFYNTVSQVINFNSKNVLEIGGRNTPRELALGESGASKWVCVDPPQTSWSKRWEEICRQIPKYSFRETTLDTALEHDDYVIFEEYAEDIPEDFYNTFDICISNCSFEHINMLPAALSKMYLSLRANGVVYSSFAPVWSAPNGSHEYIGDDQNGEFIFQHSCWPKELEHCHLLMSYSELYECLKDLYGTDFAYKYTHQIKHSRSQIALNKLFFEDYVFAMHISAFDKKAVIPLYTVDVPDERMEKLKMLYPGYRRFDVGGIVMQAIKL